MKCRQLGMRWIVKQKRIYFAENVHVLIGFYEIRCVLLVYFVPVPNTEGNVGKCVRISVTQRYKFIVCTNITDIPIDYFTLYPD